MNSKREVILLNITGGDKPGVTSALTKVLSQYDVNVLDIGQAVIHDQLSLGILFEVPQKNESAPILKDLLFKSYELGIKIRFTPITEEHYSKWVSKQENSRFIITLLSRKISSLHIAKVTEVIHNENLNIDIISRLSGRIPLSEDVTKPVGCIEFSVQGKPKDLNKMRSKFMEISRTIGVDIAFQQDNIYRRNRRLVCFDMDSTLIQAEVIDELAKYAGVGDKVKAITESAMRGEINFNESFEKRVSLLKGIDEKYLREITENLPVTEGAERLFWTLKKYGFKTAILSGGFTFFGRQLQVRFGIDYVFANELEIADGKLTGKYKGEIINGQKKAELLKKLAFKEDIALAQVVAVGDGANDIPMISLAGLGIAFHAKPKVQKNADHTISAIGLDAILYLMGFRDREINCK